MSKRATAREVAAAAGVSKWTVIRAFTPGASITEESRRRVLAAAEALNYTPNLLARSLATNLTHQVAVFVDDFANPQKLPFLEALTARLQAEGRVVMLININTQFDHVRALLNADQRQVDAVILFGTAFRDETLRDRKLSKGMPPLFVLARDSQIEGIPAVVCDAEVALRDIVSHLAGKGYRRPGFMAGAQVLSTALQRKHYFAHFWGRHGISVNTELSAYDYSWKAGARALHSYLATTPPAERIDVLMCENDILAMGALDVLRSDFGLRVPEDMAVLGFDNLELSATPAYSLTTYEQPLHSMVDAVVAMVRGELEAKTVAIAGQLILRATA